MTSFGRDGSISRNNTGLSLIRVTPAPEPATFDANVRVPGNAFLRRVPKPTKDEWAKNAFWRFCLPDLRLAYNGICAYSGCWTPEDSVDHFKPKATYQAQAYAWTNYRLAHQKINSTKGDKDGVLDPFTVQPNWFVLDFTTFMVEPLAGLQQNIKDPIQKTIIDLGLNRDNFVRLRYAVVKDYSDRLFPLAYLQGRYPFIAYELNRQGVNRSIIGTVK